MRGGRLAIRSLSGNSTNRISFLFISKHIEKIGCDNIGLDIGIPCCAREFPDRGVVKMSHCLFCIAENEYFHYRCSLHRLVFGGNTACIGSFLEEILFLFYSFELRIMFQCKLRYYIA
jgi:hypothetical protein